MSPLKKFSTRIASFKGVGLAEIGASAIILIVIVMLMMDIGLVSWGGMLCDSAARDAARAAASTNNPTKATQAAVQAVNQYQADGNFITKPSISQATTTNSDVNYVLSPVDANGNALSQSPYVTVTCRLNVLIPAPIFFFGAKLVNGPAGSGYLPIVRSYTFPIIGANTPPPTAQASSSSTNSSGSTTTNTTATNTTTGSTNTTGTTGTFGSGTASGTTGNGTGSTNTTG